MFGTSKKNENRPSLPDEVFPLVDPNVIGKQLRLEVRGLQNGRAGHPDSSAKDLDPVERDIVAAVGKLRRQGLQNAAEHERVYRERIASNDAIGPGIQQIAYDAEINFQKEVDARRGRLKDARDDLNDSGFNLAQFRNENNLNRTAYETGGLWKWAAICVVIVILESIMNGYFFAEASVAGLAGGTVTALVISIVNVGAASITGHACRQQNHARPLRRLVGWLSLIIGTGFAVFINTLVGHFRDLTATVPWDEAAGAAFERVVAGHMLQSLDAWLLTGLGLLFSVIAGWKAYGALDPYPGYSRVSDHFNRLRHEYQYLNEETLNALMEVRDKVVDQLQDECSKLQNSFTFAQSARSGLSALMRRRCKFLQECDRVADNLLKVYRDANRKARAAPEPDWQPFSFPAEEELPLPSEAPPPRQGPVKEAVERIHRTCQDAMDSFGGERGGHT